MIPCFCRSAPASPSSAICALDELRGPTVNHRNPRLDRPAVIGIVVFPGRGGAEAEAILDGEGRWSCPSLPVLDRVLNILYEPARVGGGGLPFGHLALIRAAEWLKGEVRFRRP